MKTPNDKYTICDACNHEIDTDAAYVEMEDGRDLHCECAEEEL